MKKTLKVSAIALLCLSPVLLWSLPKVAVLDLSLQKGIDSTVIAPVTESIMEEVVGARAYVVLDRAYIEQVLKEKEFQLSGLVSDTQVAQAGQYLGADYVVAGKIQMVGETYFVVAKMIEVKTGVIVAQSSEQGEGKLSVLLNMAHSVGKKLVGGAPISALTPAQQATAAPASTPAADKPKQPAEKEKPAAEWQPLDAAGTKPDFETADRQDPVPQGQVTLNILSQYDPAGNTGRAWKEIMKAFREKYPNIKIEEENIKDAALYPKRLEALKKSGKTPDIVKLDTNMRLADLFPALDLKPLLRDRLEAYMPSVIRRLEMAGGINFLPEGVTATHVFYANRRLMEKVGIEMPDNLADLLDQQQKIKKAGLIPIAMSDKDGWQAQSCLFSALISRTGGMGWLARAIEGRAARFNDQSMIQAFDIVKRLSDGKMFPPKVLDMDYNAPLDMFNQEKAVYMIDGSWRIVNIKPDMDLMVSTLPDTIEMAGVRGSTSSIMGGYGINASLAGQRAEAAWLWLWFYSGPEGSRYRFRAGDSNVSAIDPRFFLDGLDPRLSAFYDCFALSAIDDVIDATLNPDMANLIGETLKQVIAGKKKPEAAANELEKWAVKNLPERKKR